MSTLPTLLQSFFTDRLIRQRQAGPHPIAAYRDTIKLLLGLAAHTLGKQPADLDLTDLDAPMIGTFLNERAMPTSHCSEAGPALHSAGTPSNDSWPNTPPPAHP